jgi:hypothetical protein
MQKTPRKSHLEYQTEYDSDYDTDNDADFKNEQNNTNSFDFDINNYTIQELQRFLGLYDNFTYNDIMEKHKNMIIIIENSDKYNPTYKKNISGIGGSGNGGTGGSSITSGIIAGQSNSIYSLLTDGKIGTSANGGDGGSALTTGRYTSTITGTNITVGLGGIGATASFIASNGTYYGDGGSGNGGIGANGVIIMRYPTTSNNYLKIINNIPNTNYSYWQIVIYNFLVMMMVFRTRLEMSNFHSHSEQIMSMIRIMQYIERLILN